jgi:hypothetical protein
MTPEPVIGVDDLELDDAALEALAEAYAEPAPARLRARVVGMIEREREQQRSGSRVRRARVVGAIAAGVALVSAGLLGRELRHGRQQSAEMTELARQNSALAARIDEQGRVVAGLQDALDAQAQVLRLVGGPRILTATLTPSGGGAGAGRVLVDTASGDAAIVVSGLVPAAEGKIYELWAIRGKKAPEPAGLIRIVDDRGGAVRLPIIARPSEVTAFAVSIEPRGGSAAPTGPIVLVGPVAG